MKEMTSPAGIPQGENFKRFTAMPQSKPTNLLGVMGTIY